MILGDTNILVAAANQTDTHHASAVELLQTFPDSLLVPATVIAEVCYLLSTRGGAQAEAAFLTSFARMSCR